MNHPKLDLAVNLAIDLQLEEMEAEYRKPRLVWNSDKQGNIQLTLSNICIAERKMRER